MDYTAIALRFLAALGLFLWGVTMLSDGMKAVAGDRLKYWLERFTSRVPLALLMGFLATALMGSSSLVIVIVIALVSAHTLALRNALGMVLGANIGTTVSSQLFALDVNEWAALPILFGILLYLGSRDYYKRQMGYALIGLGLLFLGMMQMDESVYPLRESPDVIAWLKGLENRWLGIGTGALLTVLIQSSSATVGISISLLEQNLLPFTASVAVMLGAEIGTCADTLIASVGRGKAAKWLAIFHLVFNVTTVLLGALLLEPLVALSTWLSGSMDQAHQLANAHLLFNLIGAVSVAVLLPLLPVPEYLETETGTTKA